MKARICLTLAAMLCVMPHADPSRTLQPKPTPPLALRHPKAPAAGITVPFEYFRRHIYVTVSLQGKPGFIFMLDSGANRNILNLRTSQLLGMQPAKLQQEKEHRVWRCAGVCRSGRTYQRHHRRDPGGASDGGD